MSQYLPSLPAQTAIASKITELTSRSITELTYKGKYKIKDYKDMLDTEPVSKACVELKALRATNIIGEYEHSDKKIQAWIRSNFENMSGSFSQIIRSLCSAMPFGFAVAEIVYKPFRKQWRLAGINVLDSARVSFEGKKGRIDNVLYQEANGRRVRIPYSKCIHITNGSVTKFNDPWGSAECERAMPFYKARQVILSDMLVSAKNNATGIWLGLADSKATVELLGSNGKPIPDRAGNAGRTTVSAQEALLRQLEGIDGNNIIVTDKLNDVRSIYNSGGENTYQMALNTLDKYILRSFLVPELIFSEGSGTFMNNGLSLQHKNVLDSTIDAVVFDIRDQLVEKLIKFLILHNFGKQADYGKFTAKYSTDPSITGQKIGNLVTALTTGIIPTSDVDVVNKLRELLEVPETTVQKQMELSQITAKIQQAASGEAPEGGEDIEGAYP